MHKIKFEIYLNTSLCPLHFILWGTEVCLPIPAFQHPTQIAVPAMRTFPVAPFADYCSSEVFLLHSRSFLPFFLISH
jgi:hypothetical protein